MRVNSGPDMARRPCPGYRVYFGKAGDAVVILLCGGTKKRQDGDIAMARERWVDYKKRKAEEK